ncbi:MAG: hypothetical protein IJ343_15125 [Clostridia bacterium]|nr:hypothetical protein [Clostridia bacterium]
MKKLLALALVLATLLTSTGFLGFLDFGSKTITDPVLSPFTGDNLPTASYLSPLSGEHALISASMRSGSGYVYAQYVYDAAADRSFPVTMRRQDSDAWDAFIREAIGKRTSGDYSLYLRLLETDGPASLLEYEQLHVYSVSDRYAYCASSLLYGLLDFRTGELLPLDPATAASHITPWNELLRHEYLGDGFRLHLTDLQGNILHSADVDIGASPLPIIIPLTDGLAVLRSGAINRNEDSVISCLLLDRELNAVREITLAEALPISRINDIVLSARTGHLLISTACGLLVVPEEGGDCLLISENRGEMTSSSTTLPSDRLNSADKSYNMIHVIGFAADGSCALLSTKNSGLYKLDMNTLTLTCQMTQQELDQYNLILSDVMGMRWDGGQYAVYPRGVMRVQDR